MAFHEFGHVELQQGVFTAEEEFCQGFGQFGLPDPGGSEEEEGTDGPAGILQPGTGAADGTGNRGDGLLLSDNALAQFIFHVQQALGLCGVHLSGGNARPHGDHFRHVFNGDLRTRHPVPVFIQRVDLLAQGGFLVLQHRQTVLVILFGSQHLFFPDGTQLPDLFVGFHCPRAFVHADAGGGFIDQVNGFIRQESLGDIAFREVGGGFQCVVGDHQLMVVFILGTDAAQDLNGFLNGRFTDSDRLETAFQCRILFDVLAVFFGGCGADHLDLSAGKCRLQDVCGIHG